MSDHDPRAYGRAWSPDYDRLFEEREDPGAVVRALGELGVGRRVLEMGVGTGRIALPLVEAGFQVTGVEASDEMLAQLAVKDPEGRVRAVEGDMCEVRLDERFQIALIGFSTLFLVTDQAAQVRAIANAAAHLEPAGRLVIEAFIPDHTRWQGGQRVALARWDDEIVELETARHRPDEQRITVRYLMIGAAGVRQRPLELRYAWPAEIDLMARLAGLSLVRRTADWAGTPFGPGSAGHVSVYGRATSSG